ncbi:MAG: DUF2330 domain-containing protein [Myxococcales bacterium]|nr:DUF2330 domain-containing protein [Myxococcales bacterium]
MDDSRRSQPLPCLPLAEPRPVAVDAGDAPVLVEKRPMSRFRTDRLVMSGAADSALARTQRPPTAAGTLFASLHGLALQAAVRGLEPLPEFLRWPRGVGRASRFRRPLALRRNPMRCKPLLPVLLAALLALPLAAGEALACGGCFIPASSSPVVQDAERILFYRDPVTKKSIVWVEIKYNGPGDDFGWVLPLPKKPTVGVGTSFLFERLDAATGPRFDIETLPEQENCGRSVDTGDGGGCAIRQRSFDIPVRSANQTGLDAKLKIVEHDQVGPYVYDIIEAKEAKPLLDWLATNGYKLPASAAATIDSHVQKGDLFVAVKLKSGSSVKEIKPIALTMDDAEPCVPLRLTSVAAVDNMTVLVYLAGPGRAVPKNHLHVQVNPVRIDWFGSASNYGQVLAAAIDEAEGHAFATEFAGKLPLTATTAQPFGGTSEQSVLDLATLDLTGIAEAKTGSQVLGLLWSRKFPISADSAAILEKHLGLAAQASKSGQLVEFYTNEAHEGSAAAQAAVVDGKALAKDLAEGFVTPLKTMFPLLQGAAKFTRLAMRISPAEMTKDPIFAFHATLPDVSNVRKARVNPVCRKGDFNQDAWRLSLAGIGSYVIDVKTGTAFGPFGQQLPNNAKDARFTGAPAALVVELLDETGPARPLHKDDIALVDTAIAGAKTGTPSLPAGLTLKAATPRWTAPKSDAVFASPEPGGGCTQGPGGRPARMALLVGLGLGLLLLARRRRT